MSTQDQDLSAIFGEPARHSEYTIGQVVRYASDGRIQTGEVSWTTPADATHPLEYWVNGLTCLYSTDILGLVEEDDEPDTAILVHCPYCRTTHSPEAVQYSKQRYGKRE
jgi:hypothetical protein